MNYEISFQERAKLGMEMLSNQPLVTLQEAREQAIQVEKQTQTQKEEKLMQYINNETL